MTSRTAPNRSISVRRTRGQFNPSTIHGGSHRRGHRITRLAPSCAGT